MLGLNGIDPPSTVLPGNLAERVPVLVGTQGARKTSAVSVLCPNWDFFAEINLKRIDDDDMARILQGALVGEIAELRRLVGRDQESVKSFITRRHEKWTPKYMELTKQYPRRIVMIGTSNEGEFLDDPTGERRWLPLNCGVVDISALERDRDQLWAEGAARFKASGIAFREAERLARNEHAAFKIIDAWNEVVERWLAARDMSTGQCNGAAPFTLATIYTTAWMQPVGRLQMAEQKRLAKVLRSLGYERGTHWVEGKATKAWAKKQPLFTPAENAGVVQFS